MSVDIYLIQWTSKISKLFPFSDITLIHASSCSVDRYLPETTQNTEECSKNEVKIQLQSDKHCHSATVSINRKSREKYLDTSQASSIRQV